ncbi:MAG: [Fe-Fe] hydrogenase large subunit C-terminal domain-containing protein, partial [Candidatus Omnitrophota bacterium]
GALAKTYYDDKNKIEASKIFVVSVMPCTSKKYEIVRSKEMFSSGWQDVDVSITTRELARMIKQAGIDFMNLPDEEPDHILGDYTGAGVIFGATGGVMEAAVRTAYFYATGENLKDVEFTSVRGLLGVKEAEIDIKGANVRIAVAHGMGNVECVLDRVHEAIAKGKQTPYDFIEVMACPGGCVGGGGQPYGATDKLRTIRAKGLYQDDRERRLRLAHENPSIIKLYKEFLIKPLGEKSHKLLHTRYLPRPLYRK